MTQTIWHHAQCFQSRGVPERVPADACDCATLLALDVAVKTDRLHRSLDVALSCALRDVTRRAEAAEARVRRLTEQLQHECPHGEMSWSGVDQADLDDPAKMWACDNCGKVLDHADQHPCGHAEQMAGCGGCDPGAIEFVKDDDGPWRRIDDVGVSS